MKSITTMSSSPSPEHVVVSLVVEISPPLTTIHDPSSSVASTLKLHAASFVQPGITVNSHEPSSAQASAL